MGRRARSKASVGDGLAELRYVQEHESPLLAEGDQVTALAKLARLEADLEAGPGPMAKVTDLASERVKRG